MVVFHVFVLRIDCWFFFFFFFSFHWGMNEKTDVLKCMAGIARYTKMCTSFFHLYFNETKQINCQFLKFNFKLFSCMQILRENSSEIKQNLNWSESARKNLPTCMREWLFNYELPALKKSEISKYSLFKLFWFVFYRCRFVCFSSLIQTLPTSHCLQWRNTRFCNVLFDVTPCYWKWPCKMHSALFPLEHFSFIELWTKFCNQ